MLRQLRLCRVDAASLFGCRPSVLQRHFLRACSSSSHRSVLSDSPAATAKDPPRWVMLNLCGRRMDDSFVADAKTVADSRTRFKGLHLRVSLGSAAAPPASSFLYYDFTDSVPGEDEVDDDDDDNNNNNVSVDVIAAHTDSFLLRMGNRHRPFEEFAENDYFVYKVGGAAGPPSLSLLPDRDFLTKTESVFASCTGHPPACPRLPSRGTGLLRRGGENQDDDDLLVVQVEPWYDPHARREMLEFCVLRTGTGMRQWKLMESVPILVEEEDDDTVVRSSDAVFPVGDRYLCLVDYENGFVLCGMADEASPKVRYVPLPTEVSGRNRYDHEWDDNVFPMKYSIKMGAAGASKVRFVSIDPHCCCGGHGRSTCARSRFAFTVTTWTMDLSMDEDVQSSPLTWVKDGEVDCEEIWSLPAYEGLPRANLQCPVVSLDDPNVVCFLVSNCHFVDTFEDRKLWMIQLNIKTKTLLSVVQFTGDPWRAFHHLPAQLQY